MPKLTGAEIRKLACTIVKQHPEGIRFRPLLVLISEQSPETPRNTISGSIWDLEQKFPDLVSKPSRGVYAPTGEMVSSSSSTSSPTLAESDFYEPFASFLKAELQEATEAYSLGGSGLKGKWGTPDVIGVYRRLPSDRVNFFGEIIAAEIKIAPQEYVAGFGQAIAYKLFAAKSYIVMPRTMPQFEEARLEALCRLFGLGFVLFDLDKDIPNFRQEVPAQRSAPDTFYLNRFADNLHEHNKDLFNKVFPLF